ncbi:GNAT family N-acetyltransferase [Martelella alba]|uniref:hypothetical protein n=1 Tax=Martelella alba TaxID=2590451 RepID=UPI001F3BCE8A|nr:hypothetical protein [Martelella alba]
MSNFVLRAATIEDMAACAVILNNWIDTTEWMPRVYDHADVERHHREAVFTERAVSVVEAEGSIAGFSALADDAYVTAPMATTRKAFRMFSMAGPNRTNLGRHRYD